MLYLTVGGWMVVAWSRKSSLGPAEIAYYVCLILFKDGGCRMSSRFHRFVCDVIRENEEAG